MPQIFLFPIHRKPHGVGVNGRIIRKQGLQFGGHVVVWRNDVKEILDNAKTEIHFLLIDIVRNPRSCHATHSQSPQCKSSVPHTRMVATIVSRDCDDGHPRHEHRHSQRKLLRNLFPDLVALDVFVNFGQNTQGKNLGQHPRWWIWLRISGAKVLDEIFSRFCQFRVYKLLCLHKLFCIVKACQVGHPKRIACFSAGDIHDSTSYRHLYLLYLVEHQQTKVSVETVHIQGIVKSGTAFEYMGFLWHCQKWIQICTESVIPDVFEVVFDPCFVLDDKSTGTKQ